MRLADCEVMCCATVFPASEPAATEMARAGSIHHGGSAMWGTGKSALFRMTETSPIVMKVGCIVAAKLVWFHLERLAYTTMAGAATPAVVLKPPPTRAARRRAHGLRTYASWGKVRLISSAARTMEPTTTWRTWSGNSRTRTAPMQAPGSDPLEWRGGWPQLARSCWAPDLTMIAMSNYAHHFGAIRYCDL